MGLRGWGVGSGISSRRHPGRKVCRVQGSGFKVQGLGFGFQGSGFGVEGLGRVE